MTAERLLAELETLGVRLAVDGERLRVNAAAGVVGDALKARIGAAKPELIALLAARAGAATAPPPEGEFPVSFAQRRLWFIDQLEPGNKAYHLGAVHRIESPIDTAAMEAAVDDVRRRQPALRTVFRADDGEPVQVVRPHGFEPLPLDDLSELPEAERDAAADAIARDEAARPFDLASGPLFRARLLRLGAARYRLLFTLHHIVCDGWSLGIFLADLHVAYAARSAGQAPVYPPLGTHFGAVAERERATLTGPRLDELVSWWRDKLGSAAPVLDLPTDRPRPRERRFGGAALHFAFAPELSEALRALARRERATLYMTLLAVFKVLLFRYSGQRDIVVATPLANRNARETESVIGMFVGTLPVRSDLDAAEPFRALLARVRDDVLDAQAHAELPFEKIVDELQPERNLSWSPVYQVIFTLQNTPHANQYEVTTVASMVDLSLHVWDDPGPLRATLEYDPALFDAAGAEQLRDHLLALAAAAVATPDLAVGRLPLLTAAERRQIVEGWNETARPYPRDASLGALFDAAAARWPEAEALRSTDRAGDAAIAHRMSYGELARAAGHLASRLAAAGVRPGDPVGLWLERSIGAVVGLLAIVKAGAAYVPVDAGDPPSRVRQVLLAAGVRHVLTQRSLGERLGGEPAPILIEDAWQSGAHHEPAPAVEVAADAPAYVMFTSGTTGTPKGVSVTHRNVARLVCNTDYVELGPQETLLQLAPLAFDASTLEIWGALLNGACLVVHARNVPTAAELAEVLRTHRISTLWLTAGFFHHVVESELQALAEVRQVLAGGDVLSVTHVQRLLDAKRDGAVINGYGPTENTTFTCCHRMQPGDRLGDTVPIGRPIANTRVYVVDANDEPVPPGVRGELLAGGDGVALGYLGEAAGSAGRFGPDPFDPRPGARLYRTGDVVRRRRDGTIEFVGRRDRQVKVRGFRIELEEVEDALRTCPGVRDAVVVARPDAAGVKALVGYVVAREGQSLDVPALRTALASRLPPYMVPGVFVRLDALPLTPNGKLDRAALPTPGEAVPAEHGDEPRTRLEVQLHAIWERVLDRGGIGVHDNFFDLGGHSLLAVRLFAQIERVIGVRLPVSALFLAPDIARLARRIEEAGFVSPWSSLVAIRPDGARRPLFMVPGIGGNVLCYGDLARALGPDQPFYGLQSRGLDAREAPFERIEPMAAHYVAELRRVQPQGPYRIGGTCFGGVVAYEMAHQLRRAGEDVEMLFMLEAWPPAKPRPLVDALLRRSAALRYVASAVRRNLLRLLHQGPAGALRGLLQGARTVGEIARQGVYRGDTVTMAIDRVTLANERALARYHPPRYDGAVCFVRAAQRPLSGPDQRAQWRVLAPRRYAETDLPAVDSGHLLQAPHAEPLAAWMREQLARLDAASGPPDAR